MDLFGERRDFTLNAVILEAGSSYSHTPLKKFRENNDREMCRIGDGLTFLYSRFC